MNSTFYHNLEHLGKHYGGGRFETALKKAFDYPSKIKLMEEEMATAATSRGGEGNNATASITKRWKGVVGGVETKASDKVLDYYTPRSLRQVLEYVSIDYVLLGLKVPDWAENMLRENNR